MKRLIATLVILCAIISGIIWEQIFLTQTYGELQNKLDALIASVELCGDDDADTEENKLLIDDLYQFWLQKEGALCYLVRHTETFQVSDSIIYAKNFIEFGNKEEAMVALTKLQYLFSVRHYNIGSSLQNLI
jgi:hypothetical protein